MPTIFDDIIPNPANLPIPRATVEEMERAGERAMWDHLIRATDLERLMDRQARDEWRNSLNDNPPPATIANVYATLTDPAISSAEASPRRSGGWIAVFDPMMVLSWARGSFLKTR